MARREAFIVEAVRTPMGRRGGSLKDHRADEMAAIVLRELVRRTGVDPAGVDDVVMGCVTQIGEQGFGIGRTSVLAAGFPVCVPSATVNRMCGSGLQAIAFAAQEIASGMADLTIGAGTESMTRVQMGSDGGSIAPYITEHYNIIPQGLSAELVAERYGLTRGEIDVFSAVSHRRAAHARGQGWFQREIVPVEVGPDGNRTLFAEDETIRPDTTVEKLGTLKPAFKEGGLITAGSSSQITDGAAGVLLASREKAKALKLKTRAKVVHTACTAVNPTIMLTAPILVIPKLLDAVGLKKEDISVFEINEAFAPVVIATMKELGLDPARVNPNGGAVALGHPLGGTGARLTVSALHELERTGGRYAVISLCIGFGQGIATLIERV